ncbi:MAG: hypothetical protein KDC33_09505 [Thermoleophilia bacterium]|nr:hypothetical protein [Thermoleophilia bacterium]
MASRRTHLALLGTVSLVGVLGIAACGGSDDSSSTNTGSDTTATDGGGGDVLAASDTGFSTGSPKAGGTYRIATPDLGFTGGFDPSAEYLGWAWGLQQQLLNRGLVGYRHIGGTAGTEPMPDLAESIPEPTEDGTVWTFKIKKGVKFSPPLNREVTTKDIVYAFERMATPSVGAQYPNYFTMIKGFKEMSDGKAKTISGIATPDDQTIVFTLTKATPDFPYRLAMPASAPIPPEVGKCHTKAGEYGRYQLGTGPYMIKGADKMNISSCDAQKPIPGFNPTDGITFVRNPNYDAATDSKEQREALPDVIDISVNTNEKDVFDKVQAGELEEAAGLSVPPEVARKYVGDDTLKDRFRSNPEDSTNYVTMNLAVAPFDDIHVRKALNYAVDKQAMQRAWGGKLYGDLTGHVIPPVLLDGDTSIDPYATENSAGDVEKAKEEMKQSAYDTNKDGICDAPQCKGIVYLNRNYGAYAKITPILTQNAAAIGLGLDVKELPTGPAYETLQTVKNQVPIATNARWGKDYPDATTFAVLFDGRNILPTGNTNYSLVGMTPEQAKKLGIAYPKTPIPSVDADIDKCNDTAGEDRIQCWKDFDTKLMTEVVPWVPYMNALHTNLLGPAVTKWEYDQDAGESALAHVAVDPSLQK